MQKKRAAVATASTAATRNSRPKVRLMAPELDAAKPWSIIWRTAMGKTRVEPDDKARKTSHPKASARCLRTYGQRLRKAPRRRDFSGMPGAASLIVRSWPSCPLGDGGKVWVFNRRRGYLASGARSRGTTKPGKSLRKSA